MRRPPHEIFSLVFGVVYLGLGVSFLVVVATLPFVALSLTTDPAASWPWLAGSAPLVAPALAAAFAVFRAHAEDGSQAVVRTFAAGWVAGLRWTLGVGALASAVVVVLGVDIAWAFGSPVGAVAIPVFAMGIALVCLTAVAALVVRQEVPGVRRRDALRAGLFVVARRWYLSVLNVVVVGILGAVVAASPALGLGVALAPLLYVVWANTRFAVVGELAGVRVGAAADVNATLLGAAPRSGGDAGARFPGRSRGVGRADARRPRSIR